MGVLDLFRLDQKVALVTGVGSGLGQAMALGLAEAGAHIAGLYRAHYEETRTQVEALGRRFLPVQCDLLQATVAQLDEVVNHVVREMGSLDILVNNAGITRRAPVMEFNERDWDDVLQVDLKALFFLSQAAARIMARQGRGKIIHVASVLSFQGGLFIPAYTAAKSAVAGLTRAMANEWARLGINVNAIAPGYMHTDLTAPLRDDPQRNESISARIPAGRWGEPADLKGVVVFLASAASDYMHGTIVPVDGGWLAW
ncbi:MAG: 2-dehydro-3-deoxy-D-gluconate 5-dehydrogenase KduD [Anaerolineae bacterium]|jgi:2-deoxy-D-gluconate 3-dehydrogenase|nr:2-dehydro-3-deoxy-D-gluconate 5-dehydrogenase KduD [Anaerolineae bacterium]MDH7474327.1 2-dehydro-3-deoxy-D-gluconate 5-dehydrogenase KduD [Anaerolineae bacterium]